MFYEDNRNVKLNTDFKKQVFLLYLKNTFLNNEIQIKAVIQGNLLTLQILFNPKQDISQLSFILHFQLLFLVYIFSLFWVVLQLEMEMLWCRPNPPSNFHLIPLFKKPHNSWRNSGKTKIRSHTFSQLLLLYHFYLAKKQTKNLNVMACALHRQDAL